MNFRLINMSVFQTTLKLAKNRLPSLLQKAIKLYYLAINFNFLAIFTKKSISMKDKQGLIRKFRDKKGATQEQMAEHLGISQNAVYKIDILNYNLL